ncbi:Uncharacterized protein SCG7086_AB_00280 [Chlamydiales bacterium SCGC AG-110-P3]|nr:Uncharacterized protein SCG7086_AB_00280 [Chlamydiales bacterium SCGC AG-110-P3]
MARHTIVTAFGIALLLTGCSANQELAYHDGRGSDVVACTYKHKYGVEVPRSDWESRGRDGQVITTLKSGVTVTKDYAGGVLVGDTTYTFPHSNTIETVETYRNGKCTKIVTNYTSGLPQREEEKTASGSTVVTLWYDSGNPMSVEELRGERVLTGSYYSIDEQCDAEVLAGEGERKVRDAYGQLLSVDSISDGWLTLRTTFHSNGSPKEYIPYEYSVINGLKKTFLPSGEPSTVEEWSNGIQQGITISYRNGEKFSEIPFENGYKKGVERRYYNGAELQEEVSWHNDQRHGPTRAYVGDAVKTDWYYQNRLVSKLVFDQMAHG